VSKTFVELAEQRLSLSNLEKDLYPAYGFTKARILEYYRRIAVFILPHMKDRALTLKRYPDGVNKEFFYEKRCPSHRPDWVTTAEIAQHHGASLTACLVNDVQTLIWVANLASLELHVPLARASSPATPDAMVFDLDPGEPANILQCSRVALILRELLSRMGLVSYVKTSGQKGLHVLVPLNRGDTTFEDTRRFSKTVAEVMEKHYPNLVTPNMAKQERAARIFINWSQNSASKTMIAAYSLRAREKPFVSAPLAWSELEKLSGLGDPEKFLFLPADVVDRAEEQGDLFQEVLTKEQKLPHM